MPILDADLARTDRAYVGCVHCGEDESSHIDGRCYECGAEWVEAILCADCGIPLDRCECQRCLTCGKVDCHCEEIADYVEAAQGLLREATERDLDPRESIARWLEIAGRNLLEAAELMRDDIRPRSRVRVPSGMMWCPRCAGTGAIHHCDEDGPTWLPEWDVCPECNGVGQVPKPTSRCRTCKGTGADPLSDNLNWLPCQQCGGSGREVRSA